MSPVTRSVVVIAALGLVAMGCTREETGNPAPETSTPKSSTSTAVPSASSPSSGSGNVLSSFDPCKVLATVAGQFSLTEIAESTKGLCGAEYGVVAGVSVSIKAWPDLGYKDAKGGPNAEFSETTIGSSKAEVVRKGSSSSSCLVAVEVTPTSRVDFMSSANASLDDACAAATALATAVEPTLPK
jgi:uncharacterized protein DUF3558